MRGSWIALAVAAALVAGCGGGKPGDKSKEKAPPATLQLGAEDILTLGTGSLSGGPLITGSIQAARRADLRAEVSAVVLQVLKDNGEPVRKGELLVRLDDSSLRESLLSAQAGLRTADNAAEQAARQLARVKALQAEGMSTRQMLDEAELRQRSTQSEIVAARARLASAQQITDRTAVRAPFDGVVTDRKVSAGDTASMGKELLKVVDPKSLRFEGAVSADVLGELRTGQKVTFTVNGNDAVVYEGTLQRIDVSANPVTRQVAVIVAFSGEQQPRAAGLFAEGRVQTQSRTVLMLPETALAREGDKVSVWRVDGQTLRKTPVILGGRDEQLGTYEVRSGVSAGARVLRQHSSSLSDGQTLKLPPAAPAASSASRPASPPASPVASAAKG